MALVLRVESEYDVARIIDSLVVNAEHHARADDDTGERLLLRLANTLEDHLTDAVGDGPCFAERVQAAREEQRRVTEERRERQRLLAAQVRGAKRGVLSGA